MTDKEKWTKWAQELREYKIDFSSKDEQKDFEHEKLVMAGKIKAYRIIYKLTQEDLAKKLGIPKLQIIRWEGRKNMPNTLAMARLKEAGVIG
jgi:DNA-binding XRE family transcriptional regulator